MNLKQLSLVWNGLSGNIPTTVGQMKSLVELWLYENELSGPIPGEITTLMNVQRLWLYSNNISGPIPETIGNMTSLSMSLLSNVIFVSKSADRVLMVLLLVFISKYCTADLRLHNNTLTGRIPPVLNDMPNLSKSLHMCALHSLCLALRNSHVLLSHMNGGRVSLRMRNTIRTLFIFSWLSFLIHIQ